MVPERHDCGFKLKPELRRLICRLYAEFSTPTEIQIRLREDHGVELAIPSIIYYRDSPKWQASIAEARAALLSNLSDLPITSKYWRLKQLNDLYHKENRERIVRYSGKTEIPIMEKPIGELTKILALAAQEIAELGNGDLPADVMMMKQELEEAMKFAEGWKSKRKKPDEIPVKTEEVKE